VANTINTIKKMLDAKPVEYKGTVDINDNGDNGQFGPVFVFPPKADEVNPEAEHYPQDYVDYCLARAKEQMRQTGENPISPSGWKKKAE